MIFYNLTYTSSVNTEHNIKITCLDEIHWETGRFPQGTREPGGGRSGPEVLGG